MLVPLLRQRLTPYRSWLVAVVALQFVGVLAMLYLPSLNASIIDDGVVGDFVKRRYAGWRRGIGARIMKGQASFQDMEAYVHKSGEATLTSGREEWLENVINGYL